MTTITYKDGTIAADSRTTIGTSFIYRENTEKIHEDIGPFTILACAGSSQDIERMLREVSRCQSLDEALKLDLDGFGITDCISIGVTHDNELYVYQGIHSYSLDKDIHFAIGSGQDYALGAMEIGATAIEAIEVASKFDTRTNRNIKQRTILM